MFENMARKPLVFFVFFWGGFRCCPMWFSRSLEREQVETKVEVERPPSPCGARVTWETPKCLPPGSVWPHLRPVETPKVKREDPPPVIQGLSDEEVKRHKNSGETADRADSIQFQSIHPLQSTCENGLYPWKWMKNHGQWILEAFSAMGFPQIFQRKPWFSGKNPSHWTSRRLLEEQEKAYKAKISALEKRIKALEDEVKKLKVPWPKNGRFEEIHGFFHGFFMGKSGVKNGGDWYVYGKTCFCK